MQAGFEARMAMIDGRAFKAGKAYKDSKLCTMMMCQEYGSRTLAPVVGIGRAVGWVVLNNIDHSADEHSVPRLGLEPRTYGLKGRCSTN